MLDEINAFNKLNEHPNILKGIECGVEMWNKASGS